jgi:cell division protein DivIC
MKRIIIFTRLVFSNFYLGTSFLFFVWITFFDGNDLISLFGNQVKLKQTESEIEFFRKKIDFVIAEQNSLKGSSAAMEKFARERFLMKKDDEDVFLIKEDSDNSMFDWISKN